jgi:hypothetical protein
VIVRVPEGTVTTALMVIGKYIVGVIGTVTEEDVNAAPARLAVVVVVLGVVVIEKLEVYFTLVYTRRSLKYAWASSQSSDESPNAGARKPPRMNCVPPGIAVAMVVVSARVPFR